ncbi:MAG: tetratricopeptide repeat protein, partial [Cyanobacteria bacterium]|nr:tetratricopeptide repeat protein [Cyanobacteriota bacterium]
NYRVIIDRLEARLTFEDRWNRAITESDKEPDVERALTMLAQAQRAAEEFGDQRRVAMSLSKRAYLLMNSGRAGAAKVLYQQALAIVEKVHGKHSAFTALEYTNMGDVCVRLSQFQEALRYHRMADAIYCTKPGVAEVNRKYIRDVIVRDLKCLHGERVRAQHLQREGM